MQNRLCFHMRKTTSLQDCERIGLAALFPGLQVIPGWAFGVLVVDLSSIARESDCEIGSKFFPYEQSEFRQQILQRGGHPFTRFRGSKGVRKTAGGSKQWILSAKLPAGAVWVKSPKCETRIGMLS